MKKFIAHLLIGLIQFCIKKESVCNSENKCDCILSQNFIYIDKNINVQLCTDAQISNDSEVQKGLMSKETPRRKLRLVWKKAKVETSCVIVKLDVKNEASSSRYSEAITGLRHISAMQNEIIIFKSIEENRWMWQKPPKKDRIIKKIADGTDRNGVNFIIEEMGEQNLHEYWRETFDRFKDGGILLERIESTLKEILQAVDQLHEDEENDEEQTLIGTSAGNSRKELNIQKFWRIWKNYIKYKKLKQKQTYKQNRSAQILKLIDFGSSKLLSEVQSVDGCITMDEWHGTLEYMGPEEFKIIQGKNGKQCLKVSKKTDIWAIGIILHELLFGMEKYPFDRTIFPTESSEDFNTTKICSMLSEFKIPLTNKLDHVWQNEAPSNQLGENKDRFIKIIKIIAACLQTDPENRPSVQGITDYLDGRCLMKTEYSSRFSSSAPISAGERLIIENEAMQSKMTLDTCT